MAKSFLSSQGNHEEYTGQTRKWGEFVAERGFTVLNDTRVTLPLGAEEAGGGGGRRASSTLPASTTTSPIHSTAPRWTGGTSQSPRSSWRTSPVNEASKYRSVGLQLSGHMHGGQVFPYHVLAYLNQGYVSGLHKKDGTFLYVSEGAVGWGPRMRLLSTTEYTLVVLRSPELFSSADTSDTESTRATGAAGVLLLLSILYCLGYPVVKAYRRARGDGEGGEDAQERRRQRQQSVVSAGDYAT